jgi:hypothetical protein
MLVAVNPPADLAQQSLTLPGKPKPIAHRSSAFAIDAPAGPVETIPFYSVNDETYTTYLQKNI